MRSLASPVLELGDHPRPPVPSYIRGQEEVLLERPLVRDVYEYSTREGVSSFVVVLAALTAVLFRYTGQEHIVVGSVVPLRTGQDRREISPGAVILQVDLGGDPSAEELIRRAVAAVRRAVMDPDQPELGDERPFRIMGLALGEPVWPDCAALAANDLDAFEECMACCDLLVTVVKRDDTLRLSCEYDREILEPDTIRRLLDHLLGALARMVAEPTDVISQLPLEGEVKLRIPSGPGHAPGPSELRSYLEARLPAYMVPSAFVMLERLPLSPHGKVDRRALPAPSTERPRGGSKAPCTPTEKLVAEIWADVLRLERVGVEDDFFDLGGHSLLATQVVSRVRSVFGADLNPGMALEAPSLSAFAVLVDEAVRETTTRLAKRLDQISSADAEALLSAIEGHEASGGGNV